MRYVVKSGRIHMLLAVNHVTRGSSKEITKERQAYKTKLLKRSSVGEEAGGARNRIERMRNLSIDRLEKLPCKEFHVRKVPRDSVG